MPELAFTEQVIELGRCLIDQKQNEYPELDRDEAIPVECRSHVRQEGAEWMVFDKPEPDPVFEEARDKHDGPVENRLVQDRPDQQRAIVVADRPHRVGHQDRFSDDECRGRSHHEAAELGTVVTVIGKEQVRRQHDQIEADEKEDGRR